MWRIPTLLIGVNATTELFIRATENEPHAPFVAVALLDIDGENIGRRVHRVPVMGRVSDIGEVVQRLERMSVRPQRVLISDSSTVDTEGLLAAAAAAGMTVAYLPTITEFRGNLEKAQRAAGQVAVQDLLRRPAVVLNHGNLSQMIAQRRVLITGAGGSIGNELCRQIASYGPDEIVLVENSEYNLYSVDLELAERYPTLRRRAVLCDVRQRDPVTRLFEDCMPELVFHAAALKHVPLAECNPVEAVLTNTIGTQNVADAAMLYNALAMVQISTDKAVNPSSIMGASKRLAEYYTQALDLACGFGVDVPGQTTRFVTVRFGNVLASSGSVVQLFQRQLAKGGPLTVTHPEIKRFFMTIGEAVSLVLQASAYGIDSDDERGRILVLDMGQPVRIVDIAYQMIRLAGYTPDEDIRIEFTGLRPGEKLQEELFDESEGLLHTGVAGVLSARPAPMSVSQLRPTLEQLRGLALSGDVDGVRSIIASLIPGSRLQLESTSTSTFKPPAASV